jgi:hypothetical protein
MVGVAPVRQRLVVLRVAGVRIESSLATADLRGTVIYTYRLSRRDAIARRAHAIAWIVGLLCAAVFIFDGAITRIVLSLFASWLFLGIFFETFEATIDEEGVCEFRSLLRRKQIRAHQVRSIRGGPSDDPEESNDIFIRYDRGRVSLPGEDFVGLVQDLLALNPEIKLDLADGWFRGMVVGGGPRRVAPSGSASVLQASPFRTVPTCAERIQTVKGRPRF